MSRLKCFHNGIILIVTCFKLVMQRYILPAIKASVFCRINISKPAMDKGGLISRLPYPMSKALFFRLKATLHSPFLYLVITRFLFTEIQYFAYFNK